MKSFIIPANDYLKQNIQGFYHADYVRYRNPGNPDYVNELKNTYNSNAPTVLRNAVQNLTAVLLEDLPLISNHIQSPNITVCIVPRAKAERIYRVNQLLFKSTIHSVANQLDAFVDGTNYIVRHKNTRTTHLRDHDTDGSMPYIGITNDTCHISSDVRGKNILLIDDIYTKGINIDEDAIQALLDNGANSVTFYAIGRTLKK